MKKNNTSICITKNTIAYDEETGEVFESVTCAAKSVGRSQPALSNYLRKRQGTFAGMHWRFVC